MKAWSAEELFVRAYAAGAVAVQAVVDATRKLNELTRPPRRTGGFDEDAAGEFLESGVRCPSDGGRCECDRTSQGCRAYHTAETKLADLKADRGTGAINDGEPQQVTLSGREFERYLDGALNEPYIAPDDDDETSCYYCGEPTENVVETEIGPEHICETCCEKWITDETPNPNEPGLDDDELIGVRGLLQERYGDQSARADTRAAQVWRAGFIDETWTNDGCCVFCGATKEYVARSGGCVGPLCPHTNFAGAAVSLADGQPSPTQGAFGARNPSVREDKQQDEVTSLASIKSPADPHTTSASVKSTPGTGAGSSPSPTIASAAPRCAVGDEGSPVDSGIPQPPAGERPTSELLIDGANAIGCWLEGVSAPAVALAHWRVAADEMRERSATFVDIEQDK